MMFVMLAFSSTISYFLTELKHLKVRNMIRTEPKGAKMNKAVSKPQ